MADLIKIKSGALGNREAMPELNKDEIGYVTDKKELYIGTDDGNEKVGDASWEGRIKSLESKIQTIISYLGLRLPSE